MWQRHSLGDQQLRQKRHAEVTQHDTLWKSCVVDKDNISLTGRVLGCEQTVCLAAFYNDKKAPAQRVSIVARSFRKNGGAAILPAYGTDLYEEFSLVVALVVLQTRIGFLNWCRLHKIIQYQARQSTQAKMTWSFRTFVIWTMLGCEVYFLDHPVFPVVASPLSIHFY